MHLTEIARHARGRIATLLPARHLPGLGLVALMMLSVVAVQTQRIAADTAPAMAALTPAARQTSEKAEKIVAPPPPTAFEIESAMSPDELIRRWDPMIKSASKRFGVPQKWIRAVMRRESGGRTMLAEGVKIVSPVGAMGLMQVMPATYEELRKQHRLGDDPHHPEDNINAGAAYLAWLKSKYGFNGMFAAYNAGPGRWEQSLAKNIALPAETQNYVKSISTMLGRANGDTGVPLASAGYVKTARNERPVSDAAMSRYRKILLTIPLPPAAGQAAQPHVPAIQFGNGIASTAGRIWRIE